MSSIIDEIRREVSSIAKIENIDEPKAFALFYLREIEEKSIEDAKIQIRDGPWDRGRDVIELDEEERVLRIYQFKYSQDIEYVKRALTDIQNAIKEEENLGNLRKVNRVELFIVSLASTTPEVIREKKTIQSNIQKWLRNKGYDISIDIQIVDLKKRLLALYGRIYGIDVELLWKTWREVDGQAIIGLLDARGLVPYVESEELFAFNVRSFLGARKTTASRRIWESLSDENTRRKFWVLNNGIVCLCTSYQISETNSTISFRNFTVVNGAQTLGTIAKFLERNPVIEEPIWVVAKVLKVGESEDDREWAKRITDASNRQTPTSMRDLRAVEPHHAWLERWLQEEFGVIYLYKRGQKCPKNCICVDMKDMAQAFIAWIGYPHVAFSRPGEIFSKDDYYTMVFPNEINNLKESGEQSEVREFVASRLLPWKIAVRVREFLYKKAPPGSVNEKNRSLVYHIVWLYRRFLENAIRKYKYMELYSAIDDVLEDSVIDDLYDALVSLLGMLEDFDIPKTLKTERAKEILDSKVIVSPVMQRIWRNILETLENKLSA